MIDGLTDLIIVIVKLFVILGGIVLASLLFLSVLPKGNWNSEEQWKQRCDAGDTYFMGKQEAAACTARLLARNK